MNIKHQLKRTAAAWTPLLVLFMFLKPGQVPVVLLIIPFILLFLGLYNVWLLLVMSWRLVLSRPGDVPASKKRLGFVISLILVLLVIIESLGQLTARDVLTLVLLAAIGYFYITRYRRAA